MTAQSRPRHRSEPRPCWATVNEFALNEPGALPRICAALDLGTYHDWQPWGMSPGGWTPPYIRPAYPDISELPAFDPEVRERVYQEFKAGRREMAARVNRRLRETPVRIFSLPEDGRVLLLEAYEGSWRTEDGANRGADLIELGQWRWNCDQDSAGERIAGLIGIDVPLTLAGRPA